MLRSSRQHTSSRAHQSSPSSTSTGTFSPVLHLTSMSPGRSTQPVEFWIYAPPDVASVSLRWSEDGWQKDIPLGCFTRPPAPSWPRWSKTLHLLKTGSMVQFKFVLVWRDEQGRETKREWWCNEEVKKVVDVDGNVNNVVWTRED
ncbi:hypothetical protein M427DRAFT_157909 [Gonapodya prolifera JEL478]|uniref:Carbohydrate-binding module family 48 protein n=1 Tax=Gonapodya prolifera (strain JEL478) TaxID=1344416 RepID=A0A139A4V7_GONPJ|nr:hypothetical protein M427DRAFT_157909 [Gonapodya prolifera JEL478]|eukprot:KXS11847.1 hypothetical protein M427DRAFT_157909 [Gonapodya prolifera JEL478]